jgi:hypothetical protein
MNNLKRLIANLSSVLDDHQRGADGDSPRSKA